MLTPDTTIEDLFATGRIHVRTHNCLLRARLRTMGQVLTSITADEDLLRIRGLGRKSLSELVPLLDELRHETGTADHSSAPPTSDPWQALIARAYCAATDGDDEVAEHLRAVYPSPLSLHQAIMGDGAALMRKFSGSDKAANRERTMDMRRRLRQFVQDVLDADMGDGLLQSLVRERYSVQLALLTDHLADYSLQDTLGDLPAERLAYAEERFQALCDQHLSRFHQFRQRFLPHLTDAVAYSYSGKTPRLRSVQAAHRVKEAVGEEVARIASLSDMEFWRECTAAHHPFLDEEQCRFVCDYVLQYGHEPRFFLLYHFMLTAERRHERAHCMYNLRFGIGGAPRALEEIARIYGLSRERVRQITTGSRNCPLPVCQTSYITADDWRRYDSLWREPLIGEHTPALIHCLQRERLEGFHVVPLFRLLAASPISQHDAIEVEGHPLLISRAIAGQVEVERLVDELRRCSQGRYVADQRVAISYMATCAPLCLQSAAADIIAYMATHIYGIPVEEGHLVLRQNRVDVTVELEGILAEAGEAMSLEELHAAFAQRYPQHRYSHGPASLITPSLLKSQLIRPIGRTGRYVLTAWHLNTDTIRDILRKQLQAADTPLHISVLHEAVREHYPDVKVSSLSSTMCGKGFVRMGKGYYGLATKAYDGWEPPAKRVRGRGGSACVQGRLPFDEEG